MSLAPSVATTKGPPSAPFKSHCFLSHHEVRVRCPPSAEASELPAKLEGYCTAQEYAASLRRCATAMRSSWQRHAGAACIAFGLLAFAMVIGLSFTVTTQGVAASTLR